MVLGPSGSAAYSRGFLSLEKGDALLLYTDGMIEATDGKGKEFGIERLKKAFLAIRDRPAAEITRALIDRLSEFTQGRPPEDDRTVVVVKYLTEGTPTPPTQRAPDGAPKGAPGS
jgi:sigma-B regulation protein RsbU (phosphoserine phosphatase)